jgi:hypothetical protein
VQDVEAAVGEATRRPRSRQRATSAAARSGGRDLGFGGARWRISASTSSAGVTTAVPTLLDGDAGAARPAPPLFQRRARRDGEAQRGQAGVPAPETSNTSAPLGAHVRTGSPRRMRDIRPPRV